MNLEETLEKVREKAGNKFIELGKGLPGDDLNEVKISVIEAKTALYQVLADIEKSAVEYKWNLRLNRTIL